MAVVVENLEDVQGVLRCDPEVGYALLGFVMDVSGVEPVGELEDVEQNLNTRTPVERDRFTFSNKNTFSHPPLFS